MVNNVNDAPADKRFARVEFLGKDMNAPYALWIFTRDLSIDEHMFCKTMAEAKRKAKTFKATWTEQIPQELQQELNPRTTRGK